MNKVIVAALLFVLLTASMSSNADEAYYMVYGAGYHTCGKYLADRRKSQHEEVVVFYYTSWVKGFVTSFNMFSNKKGIISDLSDDDVVAYLDKYCSNNPLTQVTNAAMCLIGDKGGHKYSACK